MPPGHPITLLKSNQFNMAAVSVKRSIGRSIGVRAGGARGAAAPPNFGQLRFFGQREKIWAKPVLKDVSMFI